MGIPIIIDTDPGVDDIIAIAAALHSSKLDVKLISTVGGNVGIENTTRNALNLVHFFEKDVPVAKGVDKPLLKPLVTAGEVHGETGVGNFQFPTLHHSTLLKDNAVIALRDTITKSEEPITLVPIGPLTNIALLFTLFPETKENVDKIVLMGGAVQGGNQTSVAEFNMFVDPHAAKIVFNQDIPIVMCGLDLTRQTVIKNEDINEIRSLGKIGSMITDMLEVYANDSSSSKDEFAIHDLCTIIYLTNPEIFETKQAKVNVITEGEAAGCTMTEFSEDGNVAICMKADTVKFREIFIEIIKKIYETEGVRNVD